MGTRYVAQTTIQPAGPAPLPQAGADSLMAAQNWQRLGQTANVMYDMVASQVEREAQQKAIDDAPAILTPNGEGKVVPPSTFYPPGFNSGAYRETYARQAKALYTAFATNELQGTIAQAQAKFPTDPLMVSGEIEKKKEAMLAGIDPEFRPTLLLRFNALQSQAVSSTGAAKETADRQVKLDQYNRSYQDFVRNMAFGSAVMDPKGSPDEFFVNQAAYRNQWENEIKPLAAAAGLTPAAIDEHLKNAYYKAIIAASYEANRQWALTKTENGSKVLDYDTMIAARNKIYQDSLKLPAAYQSEFRQSMEGAFNQATINAQLSISAFNQKEDAPIQARALANAQKLAMAEATGNADLITKVRMDIKAQELMMLHDPSISTAGRLKTLSMLQSQGNITAAAAAPIYQEQALGLANIVQDKSQPPERQASAIATMQNIVDNPDLKHNLPIGVRSMMLSQIAEYNSAQPISDVNVMAMKWRSGTIPPETVQLQQEQMRQKGLISPTGIMKPEQALQLQEEAKTAWQKRQNQQSEAGVAGVQYRDQGRVPKGSARTSILAENQFNNGIYPDLSDPTMPDKVKAYVARTGAIPDSIKNQLLTGPVAGDENETIRKQQLAIYTAVATQEQTRFGWDNDWTLAQMSDMFGEDAAVYLTTGKKAGLKVAAETAVAGPSAARNAGAGDQKTSSTVSDLTQAFATNLKDKSGRAFADFLPWRNGTSDAVRAQEQSIAVELAAKGAINQDMLEQVWREIVPFGMARTTPPRIDLDPQLAALINQNATSKLEKKGKEYEILGGDGPRLAVSQAFAEQKHRIGLTQDPLDSSHYTLGWKSFNQITTEQFGLPGQATQSATQGYMAGIVREASLRANREVVARGGIMPSEEPYVPNLGALYDAGTLNAKYHVAPDQQQDSIIFSGQQNGIPVILMELKANDPLFSQYAKGVLQEVSRDIRNKYPDKDFSAEGLVYAGSLMTGLSLDPLASRFPVSAAFTGWERLFQQEMRQQKIEEYLDMAKPEANFLQRVTGTIPRFLRNDMLEQMAAHDGVSLYRQPQRQVPLGMEKEFPHGIGQPGSASFARYRELMDKREADLRLERQQQGETTPAPLQYPGLEGQLRRLGLPGRIIGAGADMIRNDLKLDEVNPTPVGPGATEQDNQPIQLRLQTPAERRQSR